MSQVAPEDFFEKMKTHYTKIKTKKLDEECQLDIINTSQTSVNFGDDKVKRYCVQSLETPLAFTCGDDGEVKSWAIRQQKQFDNWGPCHDCAIWSMCASLDELHLFTGDQYGNLKQWDLNTKELVKDYGPRHGGAIFHLVMTKNNKYLFSLDLFSKNNQNKVEAGLAQPESLTVSVLEVLNEQTKTGNM